MTISITIISTFPYFIAHHNGTPLPTLLQHHLTLPPSQSTNSVDLPTTTKDAIRKFRFKRFKGDAALVVKIDKKSLTIVVDEELEGTLEEIAEGKFVRSSCGVRC